MSATWSDVKRELIEWRDRYTEKGWSAFPLKIVKRPDGDDIRDFPTGYTNPDNYPAPDTWFSFGRTDLALYMPRGFLGIDVDAYDGKPGDQTIRDLEARFGELPPTISTTSRGAGQPSRIRIYRVPLFDDAPNVNSFITELPGVEFIQSNHRCAKVAPSRGHRTGDPYEWFDVDGDRLDEIPHVDRCADLPEAWVAHIRDRGRRVKRTTSLTDAGAPVTMTREDALSAFDRNLEAIKGARGGKVRSKIFGAAFNGYQCANLGLISEGEVTERVRAACIVEWKSVDHDDERWIEEAREKAAADPWVLDERAVLDADMQVVGDAFAVKHHDRFRFDTYLGRWSAYDGRRWNPGRGGSDAFRALMIFGNVESLVVRVNKDGEEVPYRMNANFVTSCLRGIEAHPRTRVDQEAWDPDPLLFNTPTGTIDLRTGEVREHRGSDLITRVSGCDYNPNATSPEFDKFLEAVLPNPKIRSYVQRVAGMSLLGEVRDHRFIVFKGRPRAGKSTLVEILGALHGEYGHFLNVKTLTEQKFDGHATELYSLRGRRFAWASEPPKSSKWDVGKIKGLTGGDSITARAMRQDEITFAPSHTLIVTSNHRPVVPAGEAAFWERYDEVPFEESFVGAEDTTLKQRIIRGELPGVLNWAIAGLRDYLAGGLQAPDEVRVVTQQARAESDPLVRFFNERVTRQEGSYILSADMLDEYNRWARDPRNEADEKYAKGWVSDVQASCNVKFAPGGVGRRFVGVAWRDSVPQVRAA